MSQRKTVADRVLECLADNPRLTAQELADELECSRTMVNRVIRRLRDAKRIRIGGYHRYIGGKGGGRWAPKWVLYDGKKDLQPPTRPEWQRERRIRYYKRNKAAFLTRQAIRRGVKRNPWMVTLGIWS